ncbi:LCP family protein [Kutzneria buriramensis]|uniref:LCP family protein required for cell wall assembly n=1 Tax=Kutzneria buriramensis TaxID=1045776 RepID=A0A3E0IAL8_9PSEU|nr:LCP family protein [Kutzneria buriramensis]REH55783.1 LCP family protein required for cell wall assembly [Kutzneria buriramensis]
MREPADRSRAALAGRVTGRTVAALMSAVVLATSGYGWVELNRVRGITTTDVIETHKPAPGAATTTPPVPGLDGPQDILIVGLDSRADAQGNPLPQAVLDELHAGSDDGELNTDTMILLHIPADGRSAVAISFPRDSYVQIAGGYGKHKLNSAYAYARNDAYSTLSAQGVKGADLEQQAAVAGRKNLIKTIENLTGGAVTINRYAEVNLASFYEISQAIGGVPVCLNAPVKEFRSGIDLPAGQQVITGGQALAFVRQRYDLPRGDLDRIVRQQAFLAGMVQKVLSADTLTSPSKLNALIDAIKKSVVISSGWDLLTFMQQLQGIAGGSVRFQTIPTGQNVTSDEGQSVTLVDPDSVHDFVAGLTGGKVGATTPTGTTTPGNGRITVDMRDGSGAGNLGASVLDELVGDGFVRGEDLSIATQPASAVHYGPGASDDADKVAAALGGKVVTEPDSAVPAGHVRVYLGKDYNGPGAQGFAMTPKYVIPSTAVTTPTSPSITAGGVPCVN